MSRKPIGVLLINLGTPRSPATKDVRIYLRQFLMDPYVIDIAAPLRWLLVHTLILPFRPKTSGAQYRSIWTDEGSPLLWHSEALKTKVAKLLGDNYQVALGMRYGTPSIEDALSKLANARCESISVLPLYPQYSLAATESSIQETKRVSKKWPSLKLDFMTSFFDHSGFLEAFERVGRKQLLSHKWDHLLFSFHGIPERHVKNSDPTKNHCLIKDDCCENFTTANSNCYRAQCFVTANELAKRLQIPKHQYTICFQSRLGRTPWLTPFTDKILKQLPDQGVKHLGVFCPTFVADCLETLEEIVVRGKQIFTEAGGKSLFLVPSLNSDDLWAEAVVDMVHSMNRPSSTETKLSLDDNKKLRPERKPLIL